MHMGIGQRFSNSWEILKACFSVLNKEKMLVLYPLISMMATGIILMIFFGFYIITSITTSVAPKMTTGLLVITIIGVLIMYFCLYFVSIFSNTAIVGCAKMRLDGKDPKFVDGFKIAFSRLPAIAGWAAVAATVGLLLSLLKGRGKVGNIVYSLLNFAWNVITYFVIPVIVVENVGPFTAIKRSLQILKKTWGEALILNFGIGMIYGIVVFVYALIFVFLVIVTFPISFVLALGIIGVGILGLIVLGAIYTALKGILMAALYKYATTGEPGYGFTNNQMENMFAPKQSRLGGGRRGLF